MTKQRSKRIRLLPWILAGLILLCLAGVGISALSNLILPDHSQFTERLSELEKARLAEAIRLRKSLGDQIWSGWGKSDIPIIVFNEEYAFLVGYLDPPVGWVKVPANDQRGEAWEIVPDDSFAGQVYYRQRLPDPEITPENFTVLVGERWVATMGTKEYMEIAFYDGFREQLPEALRPVFPLRLAWGLLMGQTENYIGGLEHEAFHAFQGSLVPERLAEAEFANRFESKYPWEDTSPEVSWDEELDLLVRAVQAESNIDAAELARKFIARRDERRASAGLSVELIDYERQREWLEGLAKYAEVSLGRLAGVTPGYTAVPTLDADPGFNNYRTSEQFWTGQVDEVRRTAGREGGTRLYYSGMAQAIVLDRLMAGWKERALEPGVMLEDLLREAAEGNQ